MRPVPIAPPGMLLPEPRAINGVPVSRAQRTRSERSSASTGTATPIGMSRAMPAASEYTARASSSVLKTPRKPGGVAVTCGRTGTPGARSDPARRDRRRNGDERPEQSIRTTPAAGLTSLEPIEQLLERELGTRENPVMLAARASDA